MAISVTNLGTNTGSGATVAISSLTVPAGSLIVVCVNENYTSATGSSVTDSAGNSYAKIS